VRQIKTPVLRAAVLLAGCFSALGSTTSGVAAERSTPSSHIRIVIPGQAGSAASGQWLPFARMLHARYGFALGEFTDGKLIAAGGITRPWPTPGRTAELFDPATGTWSKLPNLPRPRDNTGGAVGVDGRFYVMGGDANRTGRAAAAR
jgi:hypothetical protein